MQAANGNAPALSVDAVSKSYLPARFLGLGAARQGAKQALRDVSFSVETGETVGLLGPNGAGKTTMLKIIATLIHPSSGTVRIHGQDIRHDRRRYRGRLGLVTCDERSFYWRLTGLQNLRFFGALYGLDKHEVMRRCGELLETLQLTEALARPYHTYSSGMKQKLAIVRGFLAAPDILLYDEPTRALDPVSAHSIRAWIIARRRQVPEQVHIIATNTLAEAETLCDRVIVISNGEIVAQGSLGEIRRKWDVRDFETHRLTALGLPPGFTVQPAPERGLFASEREWSEENTLLTLRVARASEGLTAALQQVFAAGGVVVRSEVEQTPLDEVFYTLVHADRPAADLPREAAA